MDQLLKHPYLLQRCLLAVCPISDVIRDEPHLIRDGWDYFKTFWNKDYECMFMKQVGRRGLLDLAVWYHECFKVIRSDLLVEAARNNKLNILIWAKKIYPDVFEPNVFSQAALHGSLNVLNYFRDEVSVYDNPYIVDYAAKGNQLEVLEWMYEHFPGNQGTYYLLSWICRPECTFEVFQWVCDFMHPFNQRAQEWYHHLLLEHQEEKLKYLYQRRQIGEIPFNRAVKLLGVRPTPNIPFLEWFFRCVIDVKQVFQQYPSLVWKELEELIKKRHAPLVKVISLYLI